MLLTIIGADYQIHYKPPMPVRQFLGPELSPEFQSRVAISGIAFSIQQSAG